MKTRSPSARSGSVFFVILFAIAMFAALSYTVMKGSQSGSTSTISKDKARMAATEIIAYGDTVAKTAQTIKLRGCSDTQINFINATYFGGYNSLNTNSTAPSDESCNIFSPIGGKLFITHPPDTWINDTNLTEPNWIPNGSNKIKNIGNDLTSDLILVLYDVRSEVCIEINNRLGITNPTNAPPTTNALTDGGGFNGTYDTGAFGQITMTELVGKNAFCMIDSGDSRYKYIRVLIAR